MVTVEFVDGRGKVDFHSGEITRKLKDGFYILSFGEEHYVANSRILGIYHDKSEDAKNGQS